MSIVSNSMNIFVIGNMQDKNLEMIVITHEITNVNELTYLS